MLLFKPCINDEASIGNDGKDHSNGDPAQPDGDLGSSDNNQLVFLNIFNLLIFDPSYLKSLTVR